MAQSAIADQIKLKLTRRVTGPFDIQNTIKQRLSERLEERSIQSTHTKDRLLYIIIHFLYSLLVHFFSSFHSRYIPGLHHPGVS